MNNRAISVDIGASSGKMLAARLDDKRIEIYGEYVFINDPIAELDKLFIDVQGILNNIENGIRKFTQSHGLFDSIGIDTYGNGYGILDEQGGLISNPYYYKDRRTADILEKIETVIPLEELFQQTGIFPAKSRVLMQLYCDVLEKAAALESGRTFLPLSNLLMYLMTGEKAAERTIASVECLLNVGRTDWNYELFRRLSIPGHIFPELVDGGHCLGFLTESYIKNLNCGPMKLVTTFSHDTESALIAAPGLTISKLFLSLGTSFIFGTQTYMPVINNSAYGYQFKNMAGAFGMNSLCKDFPGFWILDRCMAEWRKDSTNISYSLICDEAQKAGENQTFLDVGDPIFQLQSDNMINTIQEYCHRTRQPVVNSRSQIVRCLFESYALYVKWLLECLKKVTGSNDFTGLVAINGGVRNKQLMQMIADALEMPVITGSPFASSMGNLLTQFYANGELSSLAEIQEVAANSCETAVYEPERSEKWNQALDFMKSNGLMCQ